MSLKNFMVLAALFAMVLPAAGCGGHKPGIATGEDIETPPQTQQEIDVERANQRKERG